MKDNIGMNMKSIRSNTAAALIGLAATVGFSSIASARIISMRIINAGELPLTMTIVEDASTHNCYETVGNDKDSNKGVPGTVTTIAPGGNYQWLFARVQGHGCGDKNGHFQVKFDPSYIKGSRISTTAFFEYDNSTNLVVEKKFPNPYPGKLTLASPAWYNFTTGGFNKKDKPLVVGKTIGKWNDAGSGMHKSNVEVERGISIGKQTEKSWSSELRKSVSTSIEASVGVEGVASSKVTVNAGLEEANGKAASIVLSKSSDFREKCGGELDMIKYDIHKVWQWKTLTPVGEEMVVVGTCDIACSPDARRPQFAPGSPEHIKSCFNERGSPKVAAVASPNRPVVAAPKSPAASVNLLARIAGPYAVDPRANAGIVDPSKLNDWHKGDISLVGNQLVWKNDAGVSWKLYFDPKDRNVLKTGTDNPYYAKNPAMRQFTLNWSNDRVTGYVFDRLTYGRE